MRELDHNRIKFFFEVMDLYNCFWLADVKHLAHEDQTTMNFVPISLSVKEKSFL
jgi:hypothetical protein